MAGDLWENLISPISNAQIKKKIKQIKETNEKKP